jgi:hypothetical protein
MASFDRINFSIRPNKHIERHLVFDALRVFDPPFSFSSHAYVGLGSLWFADFLLAHRVLGIGKMTSIQKDVALAKRAHFNKPYATIEVVEGLASAVLPTIDLENQRSVVWLDYESQLEEVLLETGEVCRRLGSGSAMLVTVNCSRGRVTVLDESERREKEEASFRASLGEIVAPTLPGDFFEARNYPFHLAQALLTHLKRQCRLGGRGLSFRPLFNFLYEDGAPMITVGGFVLDDADLAAVNAVSIPDRYSYLGEAQVQIAAPPLTAREKLALDQLLPTINELTESEVSLLGFPLRASQIRAYQRYYQQYPIFGEWRY